MWSLWDTKASCFKGISSFMFFSPIDYFSHFPARYSLHNNRTCLAQLWHSFFID
jgi:hypothetical protein